MKKSENWVEQYRCFFLQLITEIQADRCIFSHSAHALTHLGSNGLIENRRVFFNQIYPHQRTRVAPQCRVNVQQMCQIYQRSSTIDALKDMYTAVFLRSIMMVKYLSAKSVYEHNYLFYCKVCASMVHSDYNWLV